LSPKIDQYKKRKQSKNSKVENSPKSDDFNIPKEIDTHYQLFGKHVWETEKLVICNICNGGVDENGLCACGSGED
jgi:hypothetical protein